MFILWFQNSSQRIVDPNDEKLFNYLSNHIKYIAQPQQWQWMKWCKEQIRNKKSCTNALYFFKLSIYKNHALSLHSVNYNSKFEPFSIIFQTRRKSSHHHIIFQISSFIRKGATLWKVNVFPQNEVCLSPKQIPLFRDLQFLSILLLPLPFVWTPRKQKNWPQNWPIRNPNCSFNTSYYTESLSASDLVFKTVAFAHYHLTSKAMTSNINEISWLNELTSHHTNNNQCRICE